jgi:hypothetical protein
MAAEEVFENCYKINPITWPKKDFERYGIL